jgi:hypothetical protein
MGVSFFKHRSQERINVMNEFLKFLVGMSPVLVIMLCTILIGYCEVTKVHKNKNSGSK